MKVCVFKYYEGLLTGMEELPREVGGARWKGPQQDPLWGQNGMPDNRDGVQVLVTSKRKNDSKLYLGKLAFFLIN